MLKLDKFGTLKAVRDKFCIDEEYLEWENNFYVCRMNELGSEAGQGKDKLPLLMEAVNPYSVCERDNFVYASYTGFWNKQWCRNENVLAAMMVPLMIIQPFN